MATDPIAVVATFRTLDVPSRLAVLVEGESLLNDGTGVVVFNLAVAAALGQVSSVPFAVLQFLLLSAGGALVGFVLAFVVVQVLRRIDDPMVEVTLTVIAAYGSFAVAEQDAKLILLGYLIITLVRFAIVSATSLALLRSRERIPWRWTLVIGWSGLRGALAMVLALSIPSSLAVREMVIHMTFGVVVRSIILQGLTVGPLLRLIHITGEAAESGPAACPH